MGFNKVIFKHINHADLLINISRMPIIYIILMRLVLNSFYSKSKRTDKIIKEYWILNSVNLKINLRNRSSGV